LKFRISLQSLHLRRNLYLNTFGPAGTPPLSQTGFRAARAAAPPDDRILLRSMDQVEEL
jgi:hypothetical protein